MSFDPDSFNTFERTSWERRAGAYLDGFAMLSSHTVEPLLDAVGATAGTRLLDVGCGPGVLSARAVARGASVTGVDVAGPMIEIARTAVPEGSFAVGDLQTGLPYGDGAFDVITGNMVLHHLGRPADALREMRRLLTAGGVIGMTVWDSPADNPSVGLFTTALERAGAASPPDIPVLPPRPDDAGYRDLFAAAGFADVKVGHLTFDLVVEPGRWWDAVVTSTALTSALVEQQDAATQRRIRAAYDELVQQYPGPAGRVALPASATLVTASR